MKCFSMFTGIGGFDLALRRLGHDIVGACEIDPHARSVFKKQFPGVQVHNDATNLHPQSLPHIDVLSAGFPCQAFSNAGRRRGFDDTRGSLFFEIARIAKEKRPSYLLLENVKGLLSHDKGETFRTIISTLDEVGYDAEWQLLNSKYFVPQNRERVFIIGHLRGERTRQVFPLGDYDKETDRKIKKLNNERQGYKVYDTSGIGQTLAANAGGLRAKMGLIAVPSTTMIYLSNTNANMKQRVQEREETWTLGTGTDFGIKDGMRIRRLTPLECERLQGFPDNWTKYGDDGKLISDTQRYKMCGNAVTVPVIEFIAKNF